MAFNSFYYLLVFIYLKVGVLVCVYLDTNYILWHFVGSHLPCELFCCVDNIIAGLYHFVNRLVDDVYNFVIILKEIGGLMWFLFVCKSLQFEIGVVY